MNKKSIFLTLIMLAGTLAQNLGAASASTNAAHLEELEIRENLYYRTKSSRRYLF